MNENNFYAFINNFFKTTNVPILCFDLDGTIVMNNTLNRSCLMEINAIKQKGAKICVATGRTYMQSKHIINELQPNFFCALCDGRISFDYLKKSFYQYVSLDLNEDDFLFKKLFELSKGIVYEFCSGYVFSSNTVRRLFELSFPNETLDTCLDIKNEWVNSIYMVVPLEKTFQQQIRTIIKEFNNSHIKIDYSGLWLRIYSKKTDKSIPFEDYWDSMMCFGNGKNDFEILNKSKLKVVMQNSDSELMKVNGALHLNCPIEKFLQIVNKYMDHL